MTYYRFAAWNIFDINKFATKMVILRVAKSATESSEVNNTKISLFWVVRTE